MSTVFELDEDGWDQRISDARLQPQAESDPDFFDNALTATGQGIMRGGARVGQFLGMLAATPLVLAEKSLGTEGILTDRYFRALDDTVNDAVDFWTPDQRTVGMAGRVLGGLSEIALPLAAGGGNPLLMIGAQQVGMATDLTRQGVDSTTAQIVGGAQGAATALGFKIPVIGKTLGQRVMTSAVGNVGVSMATTFAQRIALEKNGYDELAEQYDPLDAEGRAVDLLIGAAFGFLPQGSAGPHVQPSAKAAILSGANARHFQVDTAPGRPLDADASSAHQKAMETALKQLLNDEPVNVPPEVLAANFEPRPAKEPLDLKVVSEVVGELPSKDWYYERQPPSRGDGQAMMLSQLEQEAKIVSDLMAKDPTMTRAKALREASYIMFPDQARPEAPRVLEDDARLQREPSRRGEGVAEMYSQLEREAAIVNELREKDPAMTRADALRIASQRIEAEDAARSSPPARLEYEPGKGLTPEDSALETRFGEQLNHDIIGAEIAYARLSDSKGGKVLNTDTARELSPDYLKDRTKSAAVHEPAGEFIWHLYRKKLAQQPKPGELPVVLFTAGGTGAGKSTAIDKALGPLSDSAQIVYDTNMNGVTSAIQKIDMALAAGKNVTIVYTYRDPIESLRHGALKRAMRQEKEFGSGRTVPINKHLETHIGSRASMERVAAHYAGDKRVQLIVLDNSRESGGAKTATLGSIPKFEGDAYNSLREQASATLEAEREAGRISEAVYRGFAEGQQAAVARGMEPAGSSGTSGQPEPQRRVSDAAFEADDNPVAPGEPFLVVRFGNSGTLTNRNGGNPQAIADFLARQDDHESARPAGSEKTSKLFVYNVTAAAPFGKYEFGSRTSEMKEPAVGRRANKDGISYSFPAGAKFTSKPVLELDIADIRSELKTRTGTDNFDDLGSIKGGKALEAIIADRMKPAQTVATATGRKIEVRQKLIELADAVTSDSPDFPKELQPRQRGVRKALDQQVRDIAQNLDPARLGDSAEADRGAPITGKGNIVESGNGRVMALKYVYENLPEKAAEYRKFLESQGYDVAGMKHPVLVRERLTDLDANERQAFTVEANQAATAALPPVERAQADARLLDAGALSAMRGGDLTTTQNAGFVRAFLERLTGSERNAMLNPDGSISQEGVRRMQAALLAKAYGGKPESNITLGRMLESTDSDMRAALGALLDAAPAFARLRQSIADGKVAGEYDISGALTEAIENTAKLRLTGQSLRDFLAQGDMLTKRAPIVDSIMKAFYDKSGTRMAGREKIAATLTKYAGQAARQRLDQASLFAEPPVSVDDLVNTTTTDADQPAPKVTDMFGLKTPQGSMVTDAAKAVLEVKDINVPTGEIDADGNPVVRSGRELMAEAEAGIAKAEDDAKGFEAAVSCILTKGLDDAA